MTERFYVIYENEAFKLFNNDKKISKYVLKLPLKSKIAVHAFNTETNRSRIAFEGSIKRLLNIKRNKLS